ncbi:MAG: hypothetical protein H0T13_03660 [Actinobacteria bacterium]|nr:hypothetical protein [Actinomycetota bacterium]
MRHRFTTLIAVSVAALTLASSAFAFDCIRVSSSLQGLQASTKSGKWLLLNFSTATGARQTFASVIEQEITPAQADCFVTEYAKAQQPLYFAIGIGVAGPNGVLAHLNPNTKVLSDGKGIDHLEAGGIFPAFAAASITCGIPLEEE